MYNNTFKALFPTTEYDNQRKFMTAPRADVCNLFVVDYRTFSHRKKCSNSVYVHNVVVHILNSEEPGVGPDSRQVHTSYLNDISVVCLSFLCRPNF